ncbi:MAG: ATP-dependent helicase [Caldilineaceae bacterium]|nr:ATP-dependent helicase [Caldilineaceae bacterium]
MNTATFVPRPAQERILAYTGGYMGISAVPGSGKTFTLSLLAARLVERLAREGDLGDREVLIVTFTNSAVENFRGRIGRFLREERGLLPGVGYRVRTLHGLAHDIVRERPSLVGLSENFDIIDDRTAADIKRDAVTNYLRTHPDTLSPFILPDFLARFRTIERDLQETAIDIANSIIRLAKEQRLEPYQLRASLDRQSGTWPLLELGLHVYADYQRSLLVRGAVDFDDLIILALRALETDAAFLERLQDRWPYVLEDEAQDSSLLQETMLRLLTQRHGNWVRVGDPNQAINTTFTSADVRFLRNFVEQNPALAQDLPNSGRSTRPIIDLANALINWSRTAHPHLPPEETLAPPLIEPTPLGDPQPNPEPGTPPFYFHTAQLSPEREVEMVLRSVARWLPDNSDKTVAILSPENRHGFRITEALQHAELPFDDTLLRSNMSTRVAAQVLSTVVGYIAQPQVTVQLERVWREVWWPRLGPPQLARLLREQQGESSTSDDDLPMPTSALRKQELPAPIAQFGQALRSLHSPESFVFPSPRDWLDELTWLDEMDGLRTVINAFRSDLQRWTRAGILPIDELLITIGAELFTEPADLALTHHLAVMLAKLAAEHAGGQDQWRLPELAKELDNIAQNRRRVLTFTDNEGGYAAIPGKITVATIHAAKGLEWDRVYLTAVNNFSFPSGSESDKYRSERYWARDNVNLVAESVEQIRQLAMGSLDDFTSGPATQTARLSLAAERLRLFYVGITRARQELIITYNTGRTSDSDPNPPALAFEALRRLRPPQAIR